MVSISQILNNGLLLTSQAVFQDVATPNQAATEQYNLIKQLNGAGPYIQHPGYGISPDVPDQCTVEQVHMISRHGERYPSKSVGKRFEGIYEKIKNYNQTFVGELAFLNDYEYFVTDENNYDELTTPFNAQGPYIGSNNALNHGAAFRGRYNELFESLDAPLTLFTTDSRRCFATARYFAQGLFGDGYGNDTARFAVLQKERPLGANTLTPSLGCRAFNYTDLVNEHQRYSTRFIYQTLDRVLKGNEDFNLTINELHNFISWCAYEINVKGSSPFCNVFNTEEFVKLSYNQNLFFYYSMGPGYYMTKAIGAPFLKATLKYLKEDNPPQKVALSFTHDNNIEHYLSALGITEEELDPLPIDYVPFPLPYSKSRLLPMGARLYTEKLKCGEDSFVRFILNDAVFPLKACQDGPGFSCKLSTFEKYVEKRLEGVDYAQQCESGDRPDEVSFLWDFETEDYYSHQVTKN